MIGCDKFGGHTILLFIIFSKRKYSGDERVIKIDQCFYITRYTALLGTIISMTGRVISY